jgi:hypothetical protein
MLEAWRESVDIEDGGRGEVNGFFGFFLGGERGFF